MAYDRRRTPDINIPTASAATTAIASKNAIRPDHLAPKSGYEPRTNGRNTRSARLAAPTKPKTTTSQRSTRERFFSVRYRRSSRCQRACSFAEPTSFVVPTASNRYSSASVISPAWPEWWIADSAEASTSYARIRCSSDGGAMAVAHARTIRRLWYSKCSALA